MFTYYTFQLFKICTYDTFQDFTEKLYIYEVFLYKRSIKNNKF